MPITLTSRYAQSVVYDAIDAQGVSHPTIAIRPWSPPPATAQLYGHVVTGVETVEYMGWRYLGDSAAWWRLADANPLIFPSDVAPGMVFEIPSLTSAGTIVRTRTF